mmetsp:Transcript_19260/g.53725  ORF Transcript_19260/g.53725 Transcript_19260/m.53725 type:complete len:255 (+) Transcript_19260:132-896(+)
MRICGLWGKDEHGTIEMTEIGSPQVLGVKPRPGRVHRAVRLPFALEKTDCLLVVDVQNDFCPGGALAVGEGDMVVPLVNGLVEQFTKVGACIVYSQDWHPAGHSSFASVHAGKKPLECVDMPYGPQTLWPDHCIQNTPGAEFHRDVTVPAECVVVRKGYNPAVDSYSAFYENDRTTSTGLMDKLKSLSIKRVCVVGLAYDFCVKFTAEDAATRGGFATWVLRDATRPVINEPGALQAVAASLKEAKVQLADCGA